MSILSDFQPRHEYLVGIDSDGCAFDTMELKHKECFIPNTVNYYELQGVSKYAREAAEFVNLYSKSRGINRFPALIETLQWLQKRPEVRARGVDVTIPQSLVDWSKKETKLGNPALERAVSQSNDADLSQALTWSKAVNETVAKIVRGVPPFPYVRECLKKLSENADVLVVSATPQEALEREWDEHGLTQFVVAICGQEVGTKKESLALARHYAPGKTLMVGDAPGDYQAAEANDALFFPINPGAEEGSWRRLFDEGIEQFFGGAFAGAYQQQLLDEFDRYLPEKPAWPVIDA
jgi:phosphoglycolate phosphatase-like HAD superfamily hydrolase